MYDVSDDTIYNVLALDHVARAVLGADTSGVSIGVNSRIHLVNDTPANRAKAQGIFDNWDGLTVTADKTTMTEGDADPVITCADALIAGDAEVRYLVLLDGEPYAEGTDTVTAGESEMTLVDPVAGVYEVLVCRLTGNYASGSVSITVNEV